MLEQFIEWSPRRDTLALIAKANEIIDEYEAQGFNLTARQLFYQFVTKNWLPNNEKNYKRLYTNVAKARNAGLIDWDAIEDRTRELVNFSSWDSPGELVSTYANRYREDIWEAQSYRPIVIIEKDALLGVIEGVCRELRVPYAAARGDASITFLNELGKRFEDHLADGLTPIVMHLSDHDPKGLDMTRVISTSLELYAGEEIEVRRLALTMQQVRRYTPPRNTAKAKDKLTPAYIREFGTNHCWELDALRPTVIADLIRSEVQGLIEPEAWEGALTAEKRGRRLLQKVGTRWGDVERLLARPRITRR
jgi:hypothetical protein